MLNACPSIVLGEFARVETVVGRTAGGHPPPYSPSRMLSEAKMLITLHCLDCGFRFSITVPPQSDRAAMAASLSCGQCGCRRWSED
jgi:hypothetical protein